MKTFQRRTTIDVSASALEQWHLKPGALQRLTPPWETVRTITEPKSIVDGSRAVVELKQGPIWQRWVAEHRDCKPGHSFSDVQLKGPFASWTHIHRFIAEGERSSTLQDHIRYCLPVHPLSHWIAGWYVRKKLERTFAYRHSITKIDLERCASERKTVPLTIAVTGATGMIGQALLPYLRMRGHTVLPITRTPKNPGDIAWNPAKGRLSLPDRPIDAAIHLAGENVAGGRWNATRKTRILESRRLGTRLLCKALAAHSPNPGVLISASGSNYYPSNTDLVHDEQAPSGDDFLSQVCQVWEEETRAAEQAGIRVVRLRIGVVISAAGGALGKMLLPFQLGAGGQLGSGTQRMPWIAIDDLVDIMTRALVDDRYHGPINTVAPEMITNLAFTKSLATTLNRPAIIPIPGFVIKALFGEMGQTTLLGDLALKPARLQDLGYTFRHPNIAHALAHTLGRIQP